MCWPKKGGTVVRNVPHVASDALTHFKGAFCAPKWAERFKGRV